MEAYDTVGEEFFEERYNNHPIAEGLPDTATPEQVVALYRDYYSLVFNDMIPIVGQQYRPTLDAYLTYLEFSILTGGTTPVKKTDLYIVELLGADIPEEDVACGNNNYNSSTYVYSCYTNSGMRPVPTTGIRMHYFNYTENKWKQYQVGSGEPITNSYS